MTRATFTETTEHGLRVFRVECRYSVTRVMVPTSVGLVRPSALVEAVAMQHEEECGQCNLDRVRKHHGDPEFKAMFESYWSEVEQEQRTQWFKDHRN
jgi:hypothetical protein